MTRRKSWKCSTLIAAAGALVAAGCAGVDSTGTPEPVENATSTVEEQTTVAQTSAGDAATTSLPQDRSQLSETNQFNLLAPGSYTSDMLSIQLEFTTTAEFNVSRAFPGAILIESPSSTHEAFAGVGFFVVDTLLDSNTKATQRGRPRSTLDLGEFLDARDGFQVVSSRDDELGGLAARVWRIEYTEPCDDCWFELLFSTTGWRNLWGTAPGQVQELWTIDAPGAPIIVTVEAPDDLFEAWSGEVQRHLFDQLSFGAPTGYSLERPDGTFAEGFGDYAIGRAELEVVDRSRRTIEVVNEAGLVVPAADDRTLLLSIAYPSTNGGFDAAPASGSFPVVIVAPALNDASIVLPADRQLASHGFVVIAVRFPESSFPGSAAVGVPQQPADISFVIDEIQRAVLPEGLAKVIDLNRLGLIGHSAGGTTAFGLLASECCQDDRFDAIVAHAGVPYDFESVQVQSTTPILHVVSHADQVSPIGSAREFHDSIDGPTAIAELEFDSHLRWLQPDASTYDDTFEFVLAFLDQHLRDGNEDLALMASDSLLLAYNER
ncbi:MAG: hypothetical protein V3V01_00705 [Acidimicrobiales bacterium]